MEAEEWPTEQYSDIGGLDKQIQELIEAVVLPMTHKDMFKNLGIHPKGVLHAFGCDRAVTFCFSPRFSPSSAIELSDSKPSPPSPFSLPILYESNESITSSSFTMPAVGENSVRNVANSSTPPTQSPQIFVTMSQLLISTPKQSRTVCTSSAMLPPPPGNNSTNATPPSACKQNRHTSSSALSSSPFST
ncbi:conserved hypothetical protein [Culex quinquefasciatus]|uniref:Uncharacterized protein n=1 Tax=Culex quinquefasciatus TaxID=7176 RepID=B0X9I1_CULQU|nr:conserved hypothetical protein [Culex quinquefasciatus]|eukprot:XP_001866303.1 conserved hypothetical protein [Culex quinquefasciatus]